MPPTSAAAIIDELTTELRLFTESSGPRDAPPLPLFPAGLPKPVSGQQSTCYPAPTDSVLNYYLGLYDNYPVLCQNRLNLAWAAHDTCKDNQVKLLAAQRVEQPIVSPTTDWLLPAVVGGSSLLLGVLLGLVLQ